VDFVAVDKHKIITFFKLNRY